MSVRTYNPKVRVGNWNEDICLEEDTVKDFLEKKERGELLIQKASKLRETILKETELSVTLDGFVHFGDCITLINEAASDQVKVLPGIEPRQQNALSVNMAESRMHQALKFEGNCDVSSSKMVSPCSRNTFVIAPVPGENIPLGTVLTYNKDFSLCTLPGIGGSLRLMSDFANFQQSAKKSRKQLLNFVEQTASPYCTHWRILCFNPQLRMETEGLPVPANQKIIFNHCKTNQDLCVISDKAIKTPFGVEYEAVAYTDLDSHKAEQEVNHWLIKTGHPGEPTKLATTLQVGEQQ